MRRNLLFYIAVLVIFGAGIYFMLDIGARLRPGGEVSAKGIESTGSRVSQPNTEAHGNDVIRTWSGNLREPVGILLLQVILILIAARLVGALFLKIGQPVVIGEM